MADYFKPLTADEAAAIAAFQKKYGKYWKAALGHKWRSNSCHFELNGDVLKRLQETHGADWLKTVKIEEPSNCQRIA